MGDYEEDVVMEILCFTDQDLDKLLIIINIFNIFHNKKNIKIQEQEIKLKIKKFFLN